MKLDARTVIPGLGCEFKFNTSHIDVKGGADAYIPGLGKELYVHMRDVSSDGDAEDYLPGIGVEWFIHPDHTVAILTGNDILGFLFVEQTGPATINAGAHTVAIEVEAGTDVSTLVPSTIISAGATVSPHANSVKDFTNPVTYTVTSEAGVAQDWVVTVTVAV